MMCLSGFNSFNHFFPFTVANALCMLLLTCFPASLFPFFLVSVGGGVKTGNHGRGVVSDQRHSVSEAYRDTETSVETTSSQSGELLFLFSFYTLVLPEW